MNLAQSGRISTVGLLHNVVQLQVHRSDPLREGMVDLPNQQDKRAAKNGNMVLSSPQIHPKMPWENTHQTNRVAFCSKRAPGAGVGGQRQ